MKTNLDDLNISNADKALIRDVQKTRNIPSLTAFVKAGINRRAAARGNKPEAFEFDFSKVTESKARKRAMRVCDLILRVSDAKALSLLCATAIMQRKACRGKAK